MFQPSSKMRQRTLGKAWASAEKKTAREHYEGAIASDDITTNIRALENFTEDMHVAVDNSSQRSRETDTHYFNEEEREEQRSEEDDSEERVDGDLVSRGSN